MDIKICKICNNSKDISEFNLNRNICKLCQRKQGTDYRNDNREKINKRRRDSRNNNKELYSEKQRIYQKKYYENNKSKKEKYFLKKRYNYLAKRNPLNILSFDEFKQGGEDTPDICEYCEITIENYNKIKDFFTKNNLDNNIIKTMKIANSMTVDRKNNFKGYQKDNMVKCCMICNAAKRNLITSNCYKIIAKQNMKELFRLMIQNAPGFDLQPI